MPRADDVRPMFDRIAGRYDLMNRVMTMGIDKRWRRAAITAVDVERNREVLDVCCGTGDITHGLAKAGARRVVGTDFSPNMLVQARARIAGYEPEIASRMEFVLGDAMSLPFDDDSFDAVTVSFGVRNVENLERAFSEFARVVRPGGRVACLEITRPSVGPARLFYGVWFHRVVPFIGGIVAGDRAAYAYLPESTKAFPRPGRLGRLMESCGLANVQWRTFAGGIVALHTADVALATTPTDGASIRTSGSVAP